MAAELADALRGLGYCTSLFPTGAPLRAESPCDFVIALEFPGGHRWPRWVLQEMRFLLAPGGHLLVSARSGAPWRRRLPRRLERRLPGADALIRPGELPRLLTQLDLELISESSLGRHESLCLCRRMQAAPSAAEHSLFADPETLRRRFQRERAAAGRRLERWCARHRIDPFGDWQALDALLPLSSPALVIAPHPDDELVGCGGTLLRMGEQGAPLTILQLTDGNASSAMKHAGTGQGNDIRLEEAAAVAARLGAELHCWREPDGRLQARPELIERLAKLLGETRPRVVFAPPLHDPHPDHAAAARMLQAALAAADIDHAQTLIAGYEVWTLVPLNALSRIDAVLEEKAELLMEHRHGMMVVDYIRSSRLAEAHHALQHTGAPGFMEAFFVLSARDYQRISG